MDSLSELLQYFIRNQDELVARYRGKVLVLHNEAVSGAYDTVLDAYLHAKAQHQAGTFMIQRCEPGTDAYTVTISSLGVIG
jgi:hypothetical protein